MIKTLRSAFVLLALEFVLRKGVEYIETYSEEKELEIEEFIKRIIPGGDFDELGWQIVKSMLPKLFEVAKTLIARIPLLGETEPLEFRGAMLAAIHESDLVA